MHTGTPSANGQWVEMGVLEVPLHEVNIKSIFNKWQHSNRYETFIIVVVYQPQL